MKRSYWAAAVLLAAVLLLAAFLLWPGDGRVVDDVRAAVAYAAQTENGEYACPVDFAALQAENKDIYAWLYIPGAGISEPLLQREGDSFYYLTHDCVGGEEECGALFTESAYNRKDFSDTATVIYGKNTSGERLFGTLQAEYSSAEGLRKNEEIIVYLPQETIRYQAFAAAPFRSYHLLHYFNFDNSTRYQAFLQAVRSVKAVDANWNEDVSAGPDSPLLILSTNRFRNADGSYLVLAKRIL